MKRSKIFAGAVAMCIALLLSIGTGLSADLANLSFNLKPGAPHLPRAPHPFESDHGWGGGARPEQIIDGYRGCNDPSGWACGLAFTGGNAYWGGEPCGIRQATITLPYIQQVGSVRITHHGNSHIPKIYEIQVWNGSRRSWVTVVSQNNTTLDRCMAPHSAGWDCMIVDEFPPVNTNKVRYTFDNCPENNESAAGGELEHGWIWEFEVYNLP